MKFDFSGWATKNDLQCSDGRTIRHGAFADCDGIKVPLVWQHMHDSPDNILGHAQLENRDEGVYAYCAFNDSAPGQQAKELVKHGDVCALSIYANHLKQQGNNVIHGAIREVSLVLTGANPGALIDNLAFAHSDGYEETIDDEAIIYNGLALMHADKKDDEEKEENPPEDEEEQEEPEEDEEEPEEDEEESEEDSEEDDEEDKMKHSDESEEMVDVEELRNRFENFTDDQKQAVYAAIAMALENDEVQHAEAEAEDSEGGPTIKDVFDSMSEEDRDVAYTIIGLALEEAEQEAQNGGNLQQSEPEDNIMKHNVFDGSADQGEILTHDEMTAIFAEAKRMGSLKDAVLEHGITNIDVFFPDTQQVGDYPALISRPMEWVAGVLAGVHKTPFSKVKSVAANLTADEARARGYIKGNKKIEEQITALKRETTPQTIYKLQKLDRDDIIDITDFDVVAFLKREMRVMLDEEVARAILIGDGRGPLDASKIKEANIRPIWTDDSMYTINVVVDKTLTGQARAEAFIDAAIRARKNYMGSGSPKLYVGTDLLTEMRLIRDKMGHRLYKNDQELADELRVSGIVEIQLFDNKTRTVSGDERTLGGLIVNLNDYNCGATKGGEVTMFDDFDIDYNKYEYLIETRMSGALYVPYSAMAIEFGTPAQGATGATGSTGATGATGATNANENAAG